MEANNSACFIWAKRLLTCILGILTPILVFAQVEKIEAKTSLPVVSNEVFQAIAQFYEYDRKMPLDAHIIWKQDYSGASQEKIVFTGVDYSKVPSFLIVPKDGKEKHPVVLIVDGYSGTKERWLQDDSWPLGGLVTKSLLKAGFAVMICDLAFHGERNYEIGFAGLPWFTEFPYAARKMTMQTARDYRRAMDYLATRSEIDNSRIGIMGLSMGGMITFQLASMDPRIKSAVAGLTALFKGDEFQSYSASTFAGHVKCNSFLMFMGNKDRFYTMKEAHELLNMIPIKNKELVEYNTGHELTPAYVELVRDWFVRNLKP